MNTLTKGQNSPAYTRAARSHRYDGSDPDKKATEAFGVCAWFSPRLIVFPFLLVVAIFGLSYFKMPFQIILMFPCYLHMAVVYGYQSSALMP